MEDSPLPFNGTISSIDSDAVSPRVVFRLESWRNSDQAFAYDPATNQVSNTGLIQKYPTDFSGIETREAEVTSADGTKVPLSILYKNGLALDGSIQDHPEIELRSNLNRNHLTRNIYRFSQY